MKQERVAIDRVMCTGHGNCAAMLPAAIRLDEWGYPLLMHPVGRSRESEEAVEYCPARALYFALPRG